MLTLVETGHDEHLFWSETAPASSRATTGPARMRATGPRGRRSDLGRSVVRSGETRGRAPAGRAVLGLPANARFAVRELNRHRDERHLCRNGK